MKTKKINSSLLGRHEDILEAIMDSSDDAIIVESIEGRIIHWNTAAEILFGYTAGEVIGKNSDFLLPANQQEEKDKLLKLKRNSKRYLQYSTYWLDKAGNLIPLSLNVSPLADENGNIIGLVKISRNIANLHSALERQAMLVAIIENSNDAIISKNLDGIIMTWNHAAEKMFGYTEQEAVGQSITMLLPTYRLPEEIAILKNLRNGQKIDHFQTTRCHKDGTELDVSLTISPIQNAKGEVVGASKIARDITAQKKAEHVIQQYAQKLEILNSVGRSISENLELESILQKVTDATTVITGAAFGAFLYNQTNEQGDSYMLYKLSGVSRSAFEGFSIPQNTSIFNLIFSSHSTVRIDDLTKDKSKGKETLYFGMSESHPNVVSYLAVPVISKSGLVIGGLFFGHPEPAKFTEEHEDLVTTLVAHAAVAIENSQLYQQVKNLNAKKDEFIALASHELKTPLTSVNGFMQLISKRIDDEAAKPLINRSLTQIKKLNILISDLLDVSRIQSGKLQFNFEVFDMGIFARELIETYQDTDDSHQVHGSVENQIFVRGDKIRLEQVINNFINNALKYSVDPANVEVCLQVVSDKAILSVKDRGIGIAPEQIHRIFEPFYRTTEVGRKIAGLGLGLYISKEIVERHGGSITVDSQLNVGSTFSFSIPLHHES